MNGQNNENQPVRPDFSGSTPTGPVSPPAGGPAPLNAGGVGFNNQPVSSGWSPNTVPQPGPIGANPPAGGSMSAPVSPAPSGTGMPSAPMPTAVPDVGSASAMPASAPMSPMPAPSAPIQPAPAPAPRPVMPPPPIGQAAASVPPSPGASQYEVKTLASDSEALKASGGVETSPKTFTPAPMSGEEFFNPAAVPAASAKKKGSNKIVLIVGIVVIVAGLAVAGFMFAKPLLTAPEIPESIPPAITPPEEVIPAEEAPAEIPSVTHASFFATPADITGELTVETVTLDSLKALFPTPEEPALADGSIRELIVSSSSGPVAFSAFLSTMLPDILPEGIAGTFEEDFTLFVHKDGTNDLPGFIAKVKVGTAPETLSAISTALETSPNAGNFYATSPGARAAFRDGAVNGDPIRYAPFATAGYAFNYGWFKDASGADYLVVASSYKGITEAVSRLGF